MVSSALVMMATLAPTRAAATAASVPACPAPTTMTSKFASLARELEEGMLKSYTESQHTRTHTMPLQIAGRAPTLFIRRAAYERAGLSRAMIDERLGLTPNEFRVEGGLVAIGPISTEDSLVDIIGELESSGLIYFDDFFELTGNWPDWLKLYSAAS